MNPEYNICVYNGDGYFSLQNMCSKKRAAHAHILIEISTDPFTIPTSGTTNIDYLYVSLSVAHKSYSDVISMNRKH